MSRSYVRRCTAIALDLSERGCHRTLTHRMNWPTKYNAHSRFISLSKKDTHETSSYRNNANPKHNNLIIEWCVCMLRWSQFAETTVLAACLTAGISIMAVIYRPRSQSSSNVFVIIHSHRELDSCQGMNKDMLYLLTATSTITRTELYIVENRMKNWHFDVRIWHTLTSVSGIVTLCIKFNLNMEEMNQECTAIPTSRLMGAVQTDDIYALAEMKQYYFLTWVESSKQEIRLLIFSIISRSKVTIDDIPGLILRF